MNFGNAIKRAIIIYGVFLALVLGCSYCHADDGYLEVRQLTLTATKYFKDGVDPLLSENGLAGRSPGDQFNLGLNTSLFSFLYWDSQIQVGSDKVVNADGSVCCGQVRAVGLELHLGVNLSDSLRVGYYHHSQHIVDSTMYNFPYPRLDGIEVQLILYSNSKKPESIF